MIAQAFQELMYMKLVWVIIFPTGAQKNNFQHSYTSICLYIALP